MGGGSSDGVVTPVTRLSPNWSPGSAARIQGFCCLGDRVTTFLDCIGDFRTASMFRSRYLYRVLIFPVTRSSSALRSLISRPNGG